MTEIKLFIAGKPEGQARPRKGKYGNFYVPQNQWAERVYSIALSKRPKKIIDFPVYVSLTFNMPKPKHIPKKKYWHTKKPDFDNIAKGTIDALTKAKFWKDDNLIAMCSIKKKYEEPIGCYVFISELSETDNNTKRR